MRAQDIILKKRYGGELSKEEIDFFIEGFTAGEIKDYQASAFAMAVCFSGMTERETSDLTAAMMNSGDTLDLSEFGALSVDKHSTGGVGDKTSLVVAPVAASLGAYVAKMSGRGLGHTGGTVDKLESIEGFSTTLSEEAFMDQVRRVGVALVGQSADLAPADKKLYAIRDVTGTVDSIPLIASSIMSKKLASGAGSIVLDVKVGSGAFMKDVESAEALARAMVRIGCNCGRNVRALITNMDVPLGRAVGNSLEVIEAVRVLKGEVRGELREICVELAANMVSMAKGLDIADARALVVESIDSGRAFGKMKEWISTQGGRTDVLDDTSLFPKAKVIYTLTSEKCGYITGVDTEKIGVASSLLGAGRMKKEDPIDYTAGIEICAQRGDYVRAGDALAVLHTSDEKLLGASCEKYLDALTFGNEKPQPEQLIYKTII